MESNTNTTNTSYNEIAYKALFNSAFHSELKKLTLDSSWTHHGPDATHGSWVDTDITQLAFEAMLRGSEWTKVGEFENGLVLQTTLLPEIVGHQAALPAEVVAPDQKVTIDMSDPFHPAAVLESIGDFGRTTKLTLIVELDPMKDPDIAGLNVEGPVAVTWFPGEPTPPSKPDGTLPHGRVTTVEEAMKHGFRTVKVSRF